MSADLDQRKVADSDGSGIRLSICISTFNRAKFIAETLDSIVCQLRDDVELLVVDGCSPDETQEVMRRYCATHPEVRYIREAKNSGVDADYDKAVGYARGQYCWLMTDDDLLVPGAVERVCSALDKDIDLVIVNAQVQTKDFTKVLNPRIVKATEDKFYTAAEIERLFVDTVDFLSFIGAVVIRRDFWLSRERERYYGTVFIHVGVIFQKPIPRTLLLVEPMITIRYGNALWSARGFQIWMFNWPTLLWSFEGISDAAKAGVTPREPFRNLKALIWVRSLWGFSFSEYRRLVHGNVHLTAALVALLPAKMLNALMSVYFLRFGHQRTLNRFKLAHCDSSSWVARRLASGI